MSSGLDTRMAEELRAAPLGDLLARLERRPPHFIVTCARGSSAHAATFAKHLFERRLGLPVAAAAPNIASLYRRRLRLKSQLFLAASVYAMALDLAALRGAEVDRPRHLRKITRTR
jgi:glucosamine--fructose-6-phosphate aminotransferase (isomerizing)